ncbi:MAG: CPBP family intramembrane metalloprotease [Betaproteobacteria bacterium]|nr:CPBP family intramembrane metalloprotease [Betaproteobacteria bacterium]
MNTLQAPRYSRRFMAPGAIAVYAAAYGACLAILARAPGFQGGEAAGILLIFGIGFTAIAWAATRGIEPVPIAVRRPAQESIAILAYLAAFAVLFLGFGLTLIREWLPDGGIERSGILVAKLVAMVILPACIFLRLGVGLRELVPAGTGIVGGKRHWRALAILCALMLLLQLTVGRGPREIAKLQGEWGWSAGHLALVAPLALAWMTLEAGLSEEFLFRVLLQTRLEAWLRNRTAAILAMAVLFGLAHAPGYVLRGGHVAEGMTIAPDPFTSAAYAIVVVSPIGFLFGVLWARTRSLGLVVLLHGFTDLVPNLASFARTWFGPL